MTYRVEDDTAIIDVADELDPVLLDAMLDDAIADPAVKRVLFRIRYGRQAVELCFAAEAK